MTPTYLEQRNHGNRWSPALIDHTPRVDGKTGRIARGDGTTGPVVRNVADVPVEWCGLGLMELAERMSGWIAAGKPEVTE